MTATASKTVRWILILAAFAVALPITARADRDDFRSHGDHHDRGGEHWRGDIRHFHERDFDLWRSGHWVHGHHAGEFGWWWVVAGLWFFYPAPVYPYPYPYTPPVVVVPQSTPPVASSAPPPPQYWYYCEPAKAYYPYVATCPVPWKAVPATPSGAPTQ